MKKAKFILTEKFGHTPEDLDVTPIMNLFCILIPFLLLTAVFAQTVVIDIALPQAPGAEGNMTQLQELPEIPEGMLQFVIINLTEKGIQVGTDKKVYPPLLIGSWQQDLDVSELNKHLSDIKANYPLQEDVVIVSLDDTRYAILVQLMDACVNMGLPNVSLSSFQPGSIGGGQ